MHKSGVLPVTDVVTVYGSPSCVDCRRTRRYLDVTATPYHWIDVEADADARALLAEAGFAALPIVVMPTGQVLVEPSDDELANVVGVAA